MTAASDFATVRLDWIVVAAAGKSAGLARAAAWREALAMRRLWFALAMVASLTLAQGARADDLADGVRAFEADEFGTAYRLLRPLADAGVAEAEFRVGLLMVTRLEEQQVPYDTVLGLRFLHSAVERGHGQAMRAIGGLLMRGRVLTQDTQAALAWFARAYAAGDLGAEDVAIRLLFHGGPGLRPDREQARARAQAVLRRRETLAHGGDPWAMIELGHMYWVNEAIPRNTYLSRTWMERAANMNHPYAQYALHNLLDSIALDGRQRGVPARELPDVFESLMWLALAAENGDVRARPIWQRTRANLRPEDAAEVERRAREWRARRDRR